MAHTYSSLRNRLVFWTHRRLNRSTSELRNELYTYMGVILREPGGQARIINGTADRVPIPAEVTGQGVLRLAERLRRIYLLAGGYGTPPDGS